MFSIICDVFSSDDLFQVHVVSPMNSLELSPNEYSGCASSWFNSFTDAFIRTDSTRFFASLTTSAHELFDNGSGAYDPDSTDDQFSFRENEKAEYKKIWNRVIVEINWRVVLFLGVLMDIALFVRRAVLLVVDVARIRKSLLSRIITKLEQKRRFVSLSSRRRKWYDAITLSGSESEVPPPFVCPVSQKHGANNVAPPPNCTPNPPPDSPTSHRRDHNIADTVLNTSRRFHSDSVVSALLNSHKRNTTRTRGSFYRVRLDMQMSHVDRVFILTVILATVVFLFSFAVFCNAVLDPRFVLYFLNVRQFSTAWQGIFQRLKEDWTRWTEHSGTEFAESDIRQARIYLSQLHVLANLMYHGNRKHFYIHIELENPPK